MTVMHLANSYSQSVIYKGEKSYIATDSWRFETNKYINDENLSVKVAKVTNSSGYLMLSTKVFPPYATISGPILLYLENGKVITLINKVSSDNVDDESIVLFSLSLTHINSLKESTIEKVRFSVDWGRKDNYTANNNGVVVYKNEWDQFSRTFEDKKYVLQLNTAAEVSELFNIKN